MNIVDLNYLEVVGAAEIAGGTGGFNFNKSVTSTVSNAINFNTNIRFNATKTVNSTINANANIKGNQALLALDAEAIGDDTLVEVDASVLTTSGLSSISLAVVSAVGGRY